MWTAAFWKAVGERAFRTFAQALIASLGAAGFTMTQGSSWVTALTTAALATLLSVLTSVAVAGVGPDGPSLGPESVDPPVDLAEYVEDLDSMDPELIESEADLVEDGPCCVESEGA